MSAGALDNARSVAARITNAMGGRGVFGVELFVKGNDVYFSEVSPRPHDTGMVTLGTQRFSEFDLHARAILGLPIDTTLISPGASTVIHGVEAKDKDIEYTGLEAAMAVEETNIYLFSKLRCYPRCRMGVAGATAGGLHDPPRPATAPTAPPAKFAFARFPPKTPLVLQSQPWAIAQLISPKHAFSCTTASPPSRTRRR